MRLIARWIINLLLAIVFGIAGERYTPTRRRSWGRWTKAMLTDYVEDRSQKDDFPASSLAAYQDMLMSRETLPEQGYVEKAREEVTACPTRENNTSEKKEMKA